MMSERHAGPYRSTRAGRWRVISRPGAVIRVEELEMTDEIRRGLTADGVDYLPPPNLQRFRRAAGMPRHG